MTTGPEPAPDPPLAAPTGRPGDPAWYTRRIELLVYVLAGVSYVALGVFHKFLLNWIIGPVWLVTVVWAAPALVDRLRLDRAP